MSMMIVVAMVMKEGAEDTRIIGGVTVGVEETQADVGLEAVVVTDEVAIAKTSGTGITMTAMEGRNDSKISDSGTIKHNPYVFFGCT